MGEWKDIKDNELPIEFKAPDDNMTLEEAIKRLRRTAECQQMMYEICTLKEQNMHLLRHRDYYNRIADWLVELKELKGE